MRLRVDDISFDSPSGLADHSDYNFRARDPRVELGLELELPAGTGTPSDEVITELHGQLDGFPVPAMSVDPPVDRELAGVPGKALRYRFEEDDGTSVHGYMVVANLGSELGDDDWIKLGWQLELPRDQVDAHIDAVLASFARADQPPPGLPQAGWVRRRAGLWALDLPEHLCYPRTHRFGDLDEEIDVSLTVHALGDPAPPLDDPLTRATRDGLTLVDREDEERDEAQIMRLHLQDDALGEERFVCRAIQTHELGDPPSECHVQIDASGPWSAAARLRAFVDDLLASVAEEDSP